MAHPLSILFDGERVAAADIFRQACALNPTRDRSMMIDIMEEWALDHQSQGNPFAHVYVEFCTEEKARQKASRDAINASIAKINADTAAWYAARKAKGRKKG